MAFKYDPTLVTTGNKSVALQPLLNWHFKIGHWPPVLTLTTPSQVNVTFSWTVILVSSLGEISLFDQSHQMV